MNEKKYEHIDASKFEFVPMDGREHDKKLESKPIGYFRDAFNRFCRNKSSVVAAIIIILLVCYAIIVPLTCENNYTRSLTDTMYLNYGKLPPKSKLLGWLGMDGTTKMTINASEFDKMRAIGEETGLDPVVKIVKGPYDDPTAGNKKNPTQYYDLVVDKYYRMGMMYQTITPEEYEKIQAWQDEQALERTKRLRPGLLAEE